MTGSLKKLEPGTAGYAYVLYHPLAELHVCVALELGHVQELLDVYHDEISSLGHVVLQACLVETLQKIVPFLCIEFFHSR